MGLFDRGKAREQEILEFLETVGRLNRENERLRLEMADIQELVRHQDEDLALLLGASASFQRGLEAIDLAKMLLDLCFRPMNLASFYVALVDFKEDQLRFILYHEGGRIRNHPPRRFSTQLGLTGRAIQSGRPLYVRTMEEAESLGAIFTEAEKLSGLIPSSWYGVPFTGRSDLCGLVSFQSFQREAFPEGRRKILDALVALFSLAYPW
jgi:hypothetical protein